MRFLKKIVDLVKQAINPKNYLPLKEDKAETLDTLILDKNGRVKVDYDNEEVRKRISKILSDLKAVEVGKTA